MQGNVKNRIKFDADFSIGQEWESICLTLAKEYSFGNVRPIFLPGMDPMALSSSLSRPRREQWVLTGAVSSRLSNSGGVLSLVRNMGGYRGCSFCTYHLGNPVFQSQSGRCPLLWLPSRTPPRSEEHTSELQSLRHLV